jgi:hypothetical protein
MCRGWDTESTRRASRWVRWRCNGDLRRCNSRPPHRSIAFGASLTEAHNPKDLAAREWFGYGRWNAPYWFVGMEPGGGDSPASYEAWRQLGGAELIDCRQHHLNSNFVKWHAETPPTQSTWRRLIQLLLGYEGKPADLNAVRRYQRDEWGSCDGQTTLLELSALHARSAGTKVARKSHRDQRLALLRDRFVEHRPEFVVFYGITYAYLYKRITSSDFDSSGYAWRGPDAFRVGAASMLAEQSKRELVDQ